MNTISFQTTQVKPVLVQLTPASRAMLHFMDQVSPTCIDGDLRLCFR